MVTQSQVYKVLSKTLRSQAKVENSKLKRKDRLFEVTNDKMCKSPSNLSLVQ